MSNSRVETHNRAELRNRIISGVSLGVVAVECGVRSGTMTTVRQALDQDRDVFAVTLETGDYVGLVWYSFRLEGLDGRREELGPFQLTVYDGAEEVPAWLGEGVT